MASGSLEQLLTQLEQYRYTFGRRDATDVAITTSFGPHTLAEFAVVTDEIKETEPALS